MTTTRRNVLGGAAAGGAALGGLPWRSARAQAALPRVFALALSLGGALSGEHGIGLSKRAFMADAFDAATLDTMRAVKRALDPDGILNPGKLLP